MTCGDRQPCMIAAVSLRSARPDLESASPTRWHCSDAHRQPRTSTCSSFATRSPYSAEPTPSPAWTGPTEPCSPPSSDVCPQCCAVTGSSPLGGPAVAPTAGHQEVDLPEPVRSPTPRPGHRRAPSSDGPRDRDGGLQAHPRRTPQTRPPHRRVYHPQDPQAAADSTSAAARDPHELADKRVPQSGHAASSLAVSTTTSTSPSATREDADHGELVKAEQQRRRVVHARGLAV